MDDLIKIKNEEKLSNEVLLKKYDEIRLLETDVLTVKKRISEELHERVQQTKNKEITVSSRVVRLIPVRQFSMVKLSLAKRYKAVRLVVDSDMIKLLIKQGKKITVPVTYRLEVK